MVMAVDLTNLLIDIEDQRHYNSCGGQALSTYLEAIWKKFDGNAQEFSAGFLWRMAVKSRNESGNIGVYAVHLFKNAKKFGTCLEVDYPYTDENLQRFPTPEEIQKAAPYRISGSREIAYEEIKGILDKGLPVFVLMEFGEGHFVNIFGYDDTGFLIVNSWGISWMNAGKQVMPYDEFKTRFKQAYIVTGLKWQWLKTAKKWFKKLFS